MKPHNSPSNSTKYRSLAGTFTLSTIFQEWKQTGRNTASIGSWFQSSMFENDSWMPTVVSHCEGSSEIPSKKLDEPCSTCRYTGMAVCAGLTLHCLKLATEANLKHNRPFFVGGAIVWASAGVYRSILD